MKGNDEMKNGKLQVALIGCGMIGHGHAEGVARDGRAEIAAVVYGKNRAAAEDFAKKYGIPFVMDDYREVIERGGIDVAIVATPSACHAEAAIAFANAGVHVLCEKPLDVEIDKMTAMIDAAEKNNVLLGCVFPNRTREDLIRAKKIIDSG
ncbi:MAG: Gfo/Idh/MocA family oxidoreductase, partial [Oscillospiraceae bacterium]|nr:Gfo/Idh/MocA family oxidoreductase [Oscillospiraceae bacterium]